MLSIQPLIAQRAFTLPSMRCDVHTRERVTQLSGGRTCIAQVYPTSPPKLAVSDLSLGVAPGERLGLLGANGAGIRGLGITHMP